MKKLLRISLLLVAMLLSSIPISAHDFEVGGIYYNITDETTKTVEVTYWGSEWDIDAAHYVGSIIIPETIIYKDAIYSVTSIGRETFRSCHGLTSVVIPNSVTLIDDYAFSDCARLTSVTIPNSVTSIGGSAFSSCTGLTSVIIPNSVTSIGSSAFYGTPWYNNQPDGLVYINKVLYAYKGTMPENTSIEIADGVVLISSSAFRGCTGLTSVTIPNSVTEIDGSAFEDCTGLTSVTIPNSVTSIGEMAFNGCRSLTSLTIGNSVTEIGGSAFSGTPWYNNQPDGLVYINKVLYDYKGIMPENTSIEIADGTVSISSTAFSSCTRLTSITIPSSVTEIEDYTFYGCTGLTSVIIPNSVTELGEGAFYKCSGLTSITIPNSVTLIRTNTFSGCTGLTSVAIPNSVTSIGSSAFYGCSALTSVTIPNSVFAIRNYAFKRCTGLTSITIPNSVILIGHEVFNGCTGLTSVTIPNSVAEISRRAFRGCTGLASVTIPNSVTSIGSSAFDGCTGLTSVVIPNSVTVIGSSVFSGCTGLKEVTIEDGADDLAVGGSVFSNVPLEKLYLGRNLNLTYTSSESPLYGLTTLKTIVLGENVTSLRENYFGKNPTIRNLRINDGSNAITLDCDFGTALDTVYIGRTINGWSVAGKKYINHISVSNNVNLTSGMFANCDSLQSLTLPFAGAGTAQTPSNFGELFGTEQNSNMRAVTQFFEDGTSKTYYLPTGLESLTLTEGCEMIPYGGLYNCNMLKALTLPTTLFMIGEKALYGCAKMTDIYCKGADPAVAYDNSFDGMRLTSCKLHVPYNSSERYKISDGWKRFYYIEEEAPLVISVAKNIENAGVVYGINEYQPGQVAEVEAVAHSGYTFVGWYENGTLLTTESKYTFVVTDSHTLVAMFAPVLDENDVDVAPQDENVTLSWAQEVDATYYSIDIYSDATMTIKVGNVVVDNGGQPVSRSSVVTTTIDGLSEMQNYYYSITSYGDGDVILSKYIGAFSTISGIDVIMGDSGAVEVARYDIHGRLLSAPAHGINIVIYSDGTTRKEFVK